MVLMRKRPTRKMLVAGIIIMLVAASGSMICYQYLRHWDTRDIAAAVTGDPNAPRFEDSLDGRTITVDGRVTELHRKNTTLGPVALVELDDFSGIRLVAWGGTEAEIGDRFSMDVRFEMSRCNEVQGVFSRQVDFPNMFILLQQEIMAEGQSNNRGFVFESHDLSNTTTEVAVDWVDDPIALDNASAMLLAGIHSYTIEYIGLFDPDASRYGRPLDRMASLSDGAGENGTLRFVDRNTNDLVDAGDSFLMDGLTKPETESGFQTYLLTVDNVNDDALSGPHVMAYIVMTNRGLVRYLTESNQCAYFSNTTADEKVTLEVEYIRSSESWDGLEVYLATEDVVPVAWTLESVRLDTGLRATVSAGIQYLGDIEVECLVEDVEGNGMIDAHDKIILRAVSGFQFAAGTGYAMMLSGEILVNGEWMSMRIGSEIFTMPS